MRRKSQPFEKKAHDLTGNAAVDLYGKDLNLFASKMGLATNPDRFELFAYKLFAEKGDLILTFFAVDKYKQEQSNYPKDKLPVKKFKLSITWEDFMKYTRRFDFVVSNGAFDISDMLVLNK